MKEIKYTVRKLKEEEYTTVKRILTPTLEELFISHLNDLANLVHENSVNKGFWPTKSDSTGPGEIDYAARNKGEMIALMHSELSELLEAVRHDGSARHEHKLVDIHCPEFTSEEIELADLIIRALDYAKGFKLRVGEAIIAKHKYNTTREYKHGKAF